MPILSRVGTGLFLKSAGGGSSAEPGEAIFHADNGTQLGTWNAYTTYTWTIPDGVTSISVVCVGGGGGGQPEHDGASGCGAALAYKNNITVVSGTDISVVVGGGGFEQNWGGNYGMDGYDSWIEFNGTKYARAGGGRRADKTQANNYITNSSHGIPSEDYDGGGSGGSGVAWGGCRQGGGAAGGYGGGGLTANGTPGNVSYSGNQATNGTGGGGGGGGSQNSNGSHACGGGGGVGIYGTGTDGQHAENASSPTMQTSYAGKGGSYDPWTTETNGLSLSTYSHFTGLRGYTNAESNTTFSNPSTNQNPSGENSSSNDLLAGQPDTIRYKRDYYDQGQSQTRPDGGFPGGGGGGGHSGSGAGAGGNGVVRIIWGTINSMTREFPTQGVNLTTVYPGLSAATNDLYGKQMMY